MMMKSDVIDIRDLPETNFNKPPTAINIGESLLPDAQVRRLHVKHVLNQVSGNKVLAAKILRISRTNLYRPLDETRGKKMNEDLEREGHIVDSR
jgi:transcriptional regulator with PAS, ATPase and Fis domain